MKIVLRSTVAISLLVIATACGKSQFTDKSQNGNSEGPLALESDPVADTQGDGPFAPPEGANVFLEGDQVDVAFPLFRERPLLVAETDEEIIQRPQHIAFFDNGSGRFSMEDESLVDFSHLLVRRADTPEKLNICPEADGEFYIYDGTADIGGEKALVSVTDIDGTCHAPRKFARLAVVEEEADDDSEEDTTASPLNISCFVVQTHARRPQCAPDAEVCPILLPIVNDTLFFEKEAGGCEALAEYGTFLYRYPSLLN